MLKHKKPIVETAPQPQTNKIIYYENNKGF